MKRKQNRVHTSTLPGCGQLRCHCGRPAILRSAEGICRNHKPGQKVYVCSDYPACDSFVLAHPGTMEPMGSLAGPKLRKLRYEAHRQFNQLYQSRLMTRREAYRWLSCMVQAPMEHAHIGHLGEYYCQVVIDESRKLLRNRLRAEAQDPAGGVHYAVAQ